MPDRDMMNESWYWNYWLGQASSCLAAENEVGDIKSVGPTV